MQPGKPPDQFAVARRTVAALRPAKQRGRRSPGPARLDRASTLCPGIGVVQRVGGMFLVLVAVAVAVHTVVEPLYHASRAGQPYSPLWSILDPSMVAAVAVGLIFAWLRKRAAGGQRAGDAVTRTWLAANTWFYGLLFVAILLLWNWFNLLSPRFTAVGDATASLVWILIDALLPLLLGTLGISLLRSGGSEKDST